MKLNQCTIQPTIKELVAAAKLAIERYAELPSIEMGSGKSKILEYITKIYLTKIESEYTQQKTF